MKQEKQTPVEIRHKELISFAHWMNKFWLIFSLTVFTLGNIMGFVFGGILK